MSRLFTEIGIAAVAARRELAGILARRLRGFGILIGCLALGVAAIAAVGGLGRAFEAALSAQGDLILGGDLAVSVNHRPLEPEQRAFLAARGAISEVATLRAMARGGEGARTALVEAKAVDAAYPLVGRLTLADGSDGRAALADPAAVLVEEALLDRLKVGLGTEIGIGTGRFRIAGVIGNEPDRLASGIGFGPRVLLSAAGLERTGLVAPGSLVRWMLRVKLPTPSSAAVAGLSADLATAFPSAGWEVRSRADAAPGTRATIDRFVQFLTLVGFATLVIGGIGVANAVEVHLEGRRSAIAVRRALGATRRVIFLVHGFELAAIAALGIALGLLVGASLPLVAAGPLGRLVDLELVPVVAPLDWALAALEGAATAALFAVMPLARAAGTSPARLFRDEPERSAGWRLPPGALAAAAITVFLVAVVLATAPDRRITTPFLGVLAVALVGLRLSAIGLVAGLRRLRRPAVFEFRTAVAAMVRPGAATGAILLSIGLGATLITALVEVRSGLVAAIERTIPGRAPSFFFLDVPAREAGTFRDFLAANAGGAKIEDVPMLRGRITRLKGVPVESLTIDESVRFILAGDRGITFSADPPANSTLTEGAWWPADHAGPPLVSFDAEGARGLGLTIGDTISVNVLGREIEAKVASLRRIEWDRMAINFFMVFSPDAFRGAPVTRLATVTWADGGDAARERALLAAVVDRFPVVTAVRVRDALAQVDALVERTARGIGVVAFVAVAAALLVLAGALAARGEGRIRNAAVLVALGATRRRLIAALAVEFAALGLIGGGFGVGLGTLAADYVVGRVMKLPFSPAWGEVAVVLAAALALTIGLGLASTRAALAARPSDVLRAST